jgi:hypothetical protein
MQSCFWIDDNRPMGSSTPMDGQSDYGKQYITGSGGGVLYAFALPDY